MKGQKISRLVTGTLGTNHEILMGSREVFSFALGRQYFTIFFGAKREKTIENTQYLTVFSQG